MPKHHVASVKFSHITTTKGGEISLPGNCIIFKQFSNFKIRLHLRCFFIVFHRMHSKEVKQKAKRKKGEKSANEKEKHLCGLRVLRLILLNRWLGHYQLTIRL